MIILDWFSFTFCPKEMLQVRHLSAAEQNLPRGERRPFTKILEDYIASKPDIEFDFLDTSCVRAMTDFLMGCSKNFISAGDDYKTADAWEECFQLRERPFGKFGYKRSWDMYFNGHVIGTAAAGAKNHGCYISFSGTGCTLIDFKKLHDKIKPLPMINITRVDLALDDYAGKYSVDYFEKCWEEEQFKNPNGGPNPVCGVVKSGGKRVKGVTTFEGGFTFYVGNREAGKLFRAYEKGRQLGDPNSKWVRTEVELHSKYRELPLDIMLNPDSYFVGSYPVLEGLEVDAEPTRIKTLKKKVAITYERSVSSAKKTYGALVNLMRERGLNDSDIVSALIHRDASSVPKSISMAYGAGT